MFHAVGLADHRWSYARISDSPAGFEAKMAALSRRGYESIFFKDHDPQRALEAKTVVLTFDDGYLDNWVHVLPVLERHGLRGTVFVNPEFVDPRPLVRPQVAPSSVADAAHRAVGCCAGFLSWDELRRCEQSGVLDVQSHALTHAWYFSGPKIVDFWHPGAATESRGPVWMLWNRFPEAKPRFLTRAEEMETEIPYGTPIYEHGKSLATRRFYPPEALDEALPDFVARNGGPAFFDRPDWRARLLAEAEAGRADEGKFETEAEQMTRVRFELHESKRLLEEQLNKSVDSICWPGGSLTAAALKIARELGYRRFTLPSALRDRPRDAAYADLSPRIGSGIRLDYRGRYLGSPTPREFIWSVERAFGSPFHGWLGRSALALRLAGSYLRR